MLCQCGEQYLKFLTPEYFSNLIVESSKIAWGVTLISKLRATSRCRRETMPRGKPPLIA